MPAKYSLAVPAAGTLLLLWLLGRAVSFIRFRYTYNFPNEVPGGAPLVGNMLQLPKDVIERRLYFHDLAKKHGEMYLDPPLLRALV